ncbi:ATP-binding protein [Microbulbifer magnicolonia]|uniref:ATP-binding protein n=1 Tax=Microbulbifer magnicolonia TaxID=3109744 RepID=UPI002B4066F6|nr:ATP-binding protein [Microbulbifer sp. GG15]
MSPRDQTAITNLRRLTALRGIALSGFLAAGLLLTDAISGEALLFVLLGLCTTLISGWRSRTSRPLHQWEFFGHLLMDWLWLPPLLAVSGGAANPFVTYLLVPLTIAAATLPSRYSWLMAGLSIAIYTGLMTIFPGTGDDHNNHGGHQMSGNRDFYQHLLGMWATFAFSALLIAGFVNSMAKALRERDDHLHRLRQEQSRREQIVSLATLAAGTAHELATPLQTMGLLVEELQERGDDAAERNADLALLQQQVSLCKQALEQLQSRARDPENSVEEEPVARFLERCLERWQLLRPEARFSLRQQGGARTRAKLPYTLEQTLINLLNNAADASTQPVEVVADWSEEQLRVQVIDSGSGHDTGSGATPKRGFGIGLILSEAALHQVGGSLTLASRAPAARGTIASLFIPLRDNLGTAGEAAPAPVEATS